MTVQAAGRADARRLLLDRPFVTTEQLMDALPSGVTPAHLRRLRLRSLIGLRFAQRGYLYPEFQLDRSAHRIDPAIARINRILLATATPEEALTWWLARGRDLDLCEVNWSEQVGELEQAAALWRRPSTASSRAPDPRRHV